MENDGGEGSARVWGWVGLFWVAWCRKVHLRWLRRRDLREVCQADTSGGMVHLAKEAANACARGSELCPGASGRLGGGPVYCAGCIRSREGLSMPHQQLCSGVNGRNG